MLARLVIFQLFLAQRGPTFRQNGTDMGKVMEMVESNWELFESDTQMMAALHHGYLFRIFESAACDMKQHSANMKKMIDELTKLLQDDAMALNKYTVLMDGLLKEAKVDQAEFKAQQKQMKEHKKQLGRVQRQKVRHEATVAVANTAVVLPWSASTKVRRMERWKVLLRTVKRILEEKLAEATASGDISINALVSGIEARPSLCSELCAARLIVSDCLQAHNYWTEDLMRQFREVRRPHSLCASLAIVCAGANRVLLNSSSRTPRTSARSCWRRSCKPSTPSAAAQTRCSSAGTCREWRRSHRCCRRHGCGSC